MNVFGVVAMMIILAHAVDKLAKPIYVDYNLAS